MPYLDSENYDEYGEDSSPIQIIVHYNYNSTYHYAAIIILTFLLYKFIIKGNYRLHEWKSRNIKDLSNSIFSLMYYCGTCSFAFTIGAALLTQKSDINIFIGSFMALFLYNIAHIINSRSEEKKKRDKEWNDNYMK